MIPENVRQIMAQLNRNGYQAYVVGGAVRDIVMGKAPSDFDIATDARPEEIHELFGADAKSTENSQAHGTVFVRGIDVTTFRTDHDEDGHSARVEFAESILDDVSRRDFTFSGMALLPNGEIYDPFDGRGDLDRKVVRAIGSPGLRIQESYVRMLRACRFCALDDDMAIEGKLKSAIRSRRHLITKVPVELIQRELMKMLSYPAPRNGIEWMHSTGLLFHVLPDLNLCFDVKQEGCHLHQFNVGAHCNITMGRLPTSQPLLRLAGLLHGVGKLYTMSVGEDGGLHFYGHEKAGAELVEDAMRRLRFSNDEISYVTTLVREHMTLCSYFAPTTMRGVRRLMARLGDVPVEDLLLLKSADRFARDGVEKDDGKEENRICQMVARIREESHALKVTDLVIGGHDLIEMGLEPGPLFGQILGGLLEEVLDDAELNNREYLLERVKETVR